MRVLEQACTFVRAIGASLHVITVEGTVGECDHNVLPFTRSALIHARVQERLARENLADAPVIIRRGNVAEEVLKEIEAGDHDVLVIGHHRGGPSWLVQSCSTAQQLGHAAPCAVLTIPL